MHCLFVSWHICVCYTSSIHWKAGNWIIIEIKLIKLQLEYHLSKHSCISTHQIQNMALYKSDNKQPTQCHLNLEAKLTELYDFIMKDKWPCFRYCSVCVWVTWLLSLFVLAEATSLRTDVDAVGTLCRHHAARSVKCSKVISLSLDSFSTRAEIWDRDSRRWSILNELKSESSHLKLGRTTRISNLSKSYKEDLKQIDDRVWRGFLKRLVGVLCWAGLVAKTVMTPPSSGKST